LRDLGGLVVIDFIDMEERRNNRKVENKLRDALSDDRARIQVGRISSFGLLELSRQRLNPSLTEAQFDKCPHCDGTGNVKSLDFAAITAIRALEEEGIKGVVSELSLNVPNAVAVYMLNNKRQMLADIEARYDFRVHIRVDENLHASEFRLDAISQHDGKKPNNNDQKPAAKQNNKQQNNQQHHHNNKEAGDNEEGGQNKKRGRRRGRRGGRRHNKQQNDQNAQSDNQNQQSQDNDANTKQEVNKKPPRNASNKQADKKPQKQSVKEENSAPPQTASNDTVEAVQKTADVVEKKAQKKSTEKPQEKAEKQPKKSAEKKQPEANVAKEYEVVNEAPKKKKKGWWNRLTE
jgi:ribonuclease E